MLIKEKSEKIWQLYSSGTRENKEKAIHLAYRMDSILYQSEISLEDLKYFLDLSLRITKSPKQSSKQILEEKILKSIVSVSYNLWDNIDAECYPLTRTGGTLTGDFADIFVKFAQEIYEVKIDRDSFAGRRRGFAVEILGFMALYFSDVPEFWAMVTTSLQNKSKPEFLNTIEILEMYYEKKEEDISDDIIALLDARIDKTKSRSEVVGALNVQIKAGFIDELDALSTLDDWKERMYE